MLIELSKGEKEERGEKKEEEFMRGAGNLRGRSA